MSDEGMRRPGTAASDEADLRELLAAAGTRPQVPAEDLAALRETARAEWRRLYPPAPRRGAVPWWLGLAAAALLATALGLGWWASRRPSSAPPPLALATVELVAGAATVASEGGRPEPLPPAGGSGVLGAGAVLETAAGAPPSRLALRLLDGASLRLDGGSRVRLAGRDEVELLAGALYVDSPAGGRGSRAGITVRTEHGIFRELGTQFEVRLLDAGGGAGVRLRVREGRVALARGPSRFVGDAGEELLVSGAAVARRSISSHDASWEWVVQSAPAFAVEGATVRDFLDWLCREAGWRLELAGAEAAGAAGERLHGSIAHLRPGEALAPVLASAGLEHRLEGGRLVVFVPPPATP